MAGFETSSSMLTFCLYELALQPEIQNKARDAIAMAKYECGGQLTYEAVMDMPYIDQILEGKCENVSSIINIHFYGISFNFQPFFEKLK